MPVFLIIVFVFIAFVLTVGGSVKLSKDELVTLAQNAGFDDPNTAAAIALAESSGNPRAYNPEKAAGTLPGHGSYGLWQIYLTAHPEDAMGDLYDPQTNAAAAFKLYQDAGQKFTPWSTFNNGAYREHL